MRKACASFPDKLETQKYLYGRVESHQPCGWTHSTLVFLLHSMRILYFQRNQAAVFNQKFKNQFQEDVYECPQMSFHLWGCIYILGRESMVFFRLS